MKKFIQRIVSAVDALLSGGHEIAPPPVALEEKRPREYNRREVVLPSGRFASMSTIEWSDVLFAHDTNALWMMTKLATRCVAIDGEPLTVSGALAANASDMLPILSMLSSEAGEITTMVQGIK